MTDDIRPVDPATKVDLLVVGGMTVDDMSGQVEAAGGAARYATEGALAAGLKVALYTASGDEPVVRAALERLAARAVVVRQSARTSIRFEHHGTDEPRRLRLIARTDPTEIPDPERLPGATAVLFAPVADEVDASALDAVHAPYRAAGLQGWLRQTDPDGWVVNRPLAKLDPGLADALRRLDLLVASDHDLGAADGPSALAALRAWAGPGPELVVTAGTDGAWLDDGSSPAHVPAHVVEGRDTIGAGDAFSAVLAARRGASLDLLAAADDAAAATARYLATRKPPGGQRPPMTSFGDLDGTAWRAVGFGPGLRESPPTGATFSLEIHGDRLSGRSGCNRYTGNWRMDGDRMSIGPLASTKMTCHEPLATLERIFLEALSAADAARQHDHLLFLDADGTPLLELVAADPSEGDQG